VHVAGKADFFSPGDLKIRQDDRLEEPIAVFIGVGSNIATYTLHRPIGITDLGNDEWVLSLGSEVETMINRRVDPDQAIINQQRGKVLTELTVKSGLLVKPTKESDVHYPPELKISEPRRTVLDSADAALKADKEKRRAEYRLAHPEDRGLNNFKYTASILDFLPPQVRDQEEKIRAFGKTPDVLKALTTVVPQTFRTGKGANNNTPQEAVPGLKGLTQAQVAQRLYQHLSNFGQPTASASSAGGGVKSTKGTNMSPGELATAVAKVDVTGAVAQTQIILGKKAKDKGKKKNLLSSDYSAVTGT